MYDNVLIGIDGRAGGRRAISLAGQLASSTAQLTLVHATVLSPMPGQDDGRELALGDRNGLAEEFAVELGMAGTGTRMLREHATTVGGALDAAAQRTDADLLVVGSSHRHGLAHLFGPDNAQSVMIHCNCAIAVADESYASRPIGTVGLAVDDEHPSPPAVAAAVRLAGELHAELVPFGVVEPHVLATTYGAVAAPIDDPAEQIRAMRDRIGLIAGHEVEVVCDAVPAALEDFSRRVDLMVCGSHHRGAVGRILLGSTSLRLARHAHCPLLIVPHHTATEQRSAGRGDVVAV